MIRPWNDRPLEVAHLFNPAYCALILQSVSVSYKQRTAKGLPFALAFVALPVVLHPSLNEKLPSSARTKLHVWLQEQPEVRLGFAQRAMSTNEYTREAIGFGLRYRALIVTPNGRLEGRPVRKTRSGKVRPNPSQHYALKKADVVGKMFGQIDDPASVFAMFGVRP